MPRPVEKKGTAKRDHQRAFISERAKDLAVMYLTRRKDLAVNCQGNADHWLDCTVEITGKEKPSRRVFGVALKGTMSPVTDDHANKALHPVLQTMQTRRFPFPVGLLYFTMANNEGRFAWIAEPTIKNGSPVLHCHEEARTTPLDNGLLDETVDKVNQWFDAMPADEGNVACGQCGTVLYGEPPSCALSGRKPCPRCGSTTRSFSVRVSADVTLSGGSHVEVVTYPQSLLETAKNLVKTEQYNEALTIAHMACEIAAERAFAQALAGNQSWPRKWTADELPSGYNLGNERTREQYTALTGDNIQNQPFWRPFKRFVALRNGIVHGTTTVSRADVESSLSAASSLVRYLDLR